MIPTDGPERSPSRPRLVAVPARALRLTALALAIALFAAACSGGSSTDDAASTTGDEETATPAPTVELVPLPTATVEPTPDPSPTSTPEPGDEAADDTEDSKQDDDVVWTHIEDFDLVFENGRPDLDAAVTTFYDVGGGDIAESVDSLLASIDHPLEWQDVADAAVGTFPEGLGESAGIFALLSSQWSVIGCETHLAGMNINRWNELLFEHLVAEAANLPADQADNQAGILLGATNAGIARLCPRLIPS